MIIYLAPGWTNYASEVNGYVLALRDAEHPMVLHSFVFTNGRELPTLNKGAPDADLPGQLTAA